MTDLISDENSKLHNAEAAVEKMREIKKIKNVSPETIASWIYEGRRTSFALPNSNKPFA